mgnify:CR=1 FL=1
MMQNPYQKIVQQSISTMTPAQLLIALYEKGETELSKAIYFIENKDLPKAHNSIMKAQNIISTLDSSLKTKYEISESLGALYDYMYKRLVEANIKKDIEIIKEIIPFFRELKETFTEINKRSPQ